jgi:hypothetical protein
MEATITYTSTSDRRRYVCPSCSYEAVVEVLGIGAGAQTSLNPSGTSLKRAERDAVNQIDVAVGLATCPRCGHHDASAARRWWRTHLTPMVSMAAGFSLLGWTPLILDLNVSDQLLVGWIVTGIVVLTLPYYLSTTWTSWRDAKDGVRFPEDPALVRSGVSTPSRSR